MSGCRGSSGRTGGRPSSAPCAHKSAAAPLRQPASRLCSAVGPRGAREGCAESQRGGPLSRGRRASRVQEAGRLVDGAGAFTRTGRLWQGAGGRGGTRAPVWRDQMRVGCARGPKGLSGSHQTIQASPTGWRGSLLVGLRLQGLDCPGQVP